MLLVFLGFLYFWMFFFWFLKILSVGNFCILYLVVSGLFFFLLVLILVSMIGGLCLLSFLVVFLYWNIKENVV